MPSKSLFHMLCFLFSLGQEDEEEKMALFMKRIINFQQMMRCKGALLRKDWKIINLLLFSGLQEDGPG